MTVALVAAAATAVAGMSLPATVPVAARDKKRVLMLISDTGGGHRASALALQAAMQTGRPKNDVDVKIVDIWTEYGAFPHSKYAQGYPFLCKYSFLWKALYYISIPWEVPWALETRVRCGARFKQCIDEYRPDLVVSLHPLCQHLPIKVIDTLTKEGKLDQPPFATVCTDLGGAHPNWFLKQADACFVPSDAVHKVASRRGVDESRIRQYGLPVRRDFWKATSSPRTVSAKHARELGLLPNRRTVLVIGGGDGVGSLGKIVEATATKLATELPDSAQVVAICGRNRVVQQQLEAKKAQWGGVHVEVRGFTSQISDFMEASDCLITKAGPGTIAEAAVRGLPTMLSSFLPGQEAGNVPFVISSGFGDFAKKPEVIARKVSAWLKDDALLAEKSEAALRVATPDATQQIASDLLQMLDAHTQAR